MDSTKNLPQTLYSATGQIKLYIKFPFIKNSKFICFSVISDYFTEEIASTKISIDNLGQKILVSFLLKFLIFIYYLNFLINI